jgi:pimeloyl-ACP methyl ester carboxylesterase
VSAAPRAIDVAVAGGPRLRALCWGDPGGSPLLLVHGAGGHALWWAEIAPALAARHWVVAPDLRGHGASAHSDSYLLEDFAADCLAVLDQLAPGPVGLIGHSMGGRVATWIAAHHPERARALALLDTRLSPVPRERAARWRGARAADRPRRRHPTRAEAMRAFRLTPPEADVPPAVHDALATYAVAQGDDGQWCLAVDRNVLAVSDSRAADLLPLLAGVRCPVLLLRGRDSNVIGAQHAAALGTVLPDATQETVAGGHHFLLAHAGATADRLASFFA